MARKNSKKKHSPEKPDYWERLSPQKKHFACLGFLFILPFFLFNASTIGGQQYMGHDVIQWRAGAESLIEHRETFDEVAHWAANMFSGMPATTISHPPQIPNLDNTLLRALSFIYPAIEFWILFGGAYLMFILMGARPLTSVFGAVVIGFSTYIPIIIGAGHNAKFLSYIYIPWLFTGYFLMTRSQLNRWLATFIFALALTLHLRAYHPQVTYFFLFPLLAMFIFDLVKACKEEKLNKFLNHTGWLSAAAVIAILISVQLYWSTAEYSPYSMRGGSEVAQTDGLSQDYAFAWSQGVGELLTLVIPNSFGGSSGDAYWGPKSFTSGPHYMGALTFLLFVIGLLKSRHRLKWIFFGSGFATMLFSLGENFMALNSIMFNYFPLFDKFRAPEMWLMVTVFCFGVVAVMGFEWIVDQIKKRNNSNEWKKSVLISGGVGLFLIFIWFQMLSFEKPGERQQMAQQIAQQNEVPIDDPRVAQTVNRYVNSELIPERRDMARTDSLRFGIYIAIGIGIFFFISAAKIPASAGMGIICLLLAIDMIQVDNRYLSDQSLVDGDISREQVIENQISGLDRFIEENISHENGWNYRGFPLARNPFNDAIPAYSYPSVGGYSGAKLGYYQDLIDEAFFSGPVGINTGVMDMLNIKYLTARGAVNIPGFEMIHQTQEGVVLENQTVLPKAWFVDSVEILENQTSVLREVAQDFDAKETAFITQELSTPIQADSESFVQVAEYTPNNITVDISRSEPGFMVLSEIWYPPGWTVTLNGKEIEVIRTNYVLRGFEIPAGDHQLQMTFEPVWYAIGNRLARIGTFALLGVGILGVVFYYRKEDDDQANPE